MAKDECLKWMKAHPGRKITCNELAEILQANANTISLSLRRLHRDGEISKEKAPTGIQGNKPFLYWVEFDKMQTTPAL